ncbi:MAG: ribosome biogenesis GTP-binding protein YihA/YsxC [Bacteroidales bacterium]|nr:ribosome biogenesis GTP-binding protein YihA/YsxC [Bacteroidales bacterium]
MPIKEVEFVKSCSKVEQCPVSSYPEYAFVGRSNVGKSSLINYLTNKKSIAKTSGKPGCTKLINYFVVDESWYLVDLPGYGYAKVSKKERGVFSEIITSYLNERLNLTCLFLLIDCRHEPLSSDMEFMEWLGVNQIPFVIVFTKSDKLSDNQLEESLIRYKNKLLETWEYLPGIYTTSVLKKRGAEEILDFIRDTNAEIQ